MMPSPQTRFHGLGSSHSKVAQTMVTATTNGTIEITGNKLKLKGNAKEGVGNVTDDDRMRDEGRSDQAKGKGRQKYGEAKYWVEEKKKDQDS
jgi:uncharacterized protein YjbJ (UPF0337 family)